MSNMTDYMENKLADFARGQGLTLPTSWFFALGSAATDSSFTELSGTGYGRVVQARSLANFASTNGQGTTLASTGTTHSTSNNNALNWGTSGSAWGTANCVGMFDAASGGNSWAWLDLDVPLVIGNGAAVSLPAGDVGFTLGITGGCSDYLSNKLIDLIWRAQTFAWPANLSASLYTAAPSNAGGGTEVSAADYARVAIPSYMAAWSGTQAAGSTSASTGTGGRISNNAAVTYPIPLTNWGAVTHEALKDANTAGNLMFWGPLAIPRTVSVGLPQSHPANSMSITFA